MLQIFLIILILQLQPFEFFDQLIFLYQHIFHNTLKILLSLANLSDLLLLLYVQQSLFEKLMFVFQFYKLLLLISEGLFVLSFYFLFLQLQPFPRLQQSLQPHPQVTNRVNLIVQISLAGVKIFFYLYVYQTLSLHQFFLFNS